MQKQYTFIFLIVLMLTDGCVPVSNTTSNTSKKLYFDNINYEENVGMVQLFPFSQTLQSDLENPVISIKNSDGFYLKFDMLQENYANYNVRYVHCNRDWSPSNLASIRFLDEYNSFPINEYQYSTNTRKPYVAYGIRLPTPKISGNYLIVVSKTTNDLDLILTRRALVYEQHINISAEVGVSMTVAKRAINQQVSMKLSYNGLDNINPMRDFNVALIQNHNWESSINDLKPTLVRPDQQYMEYRHFTGENGFPGHNEFRFFDMRSIDYRGMNVVDVQKDDFNVKVFLGIDKPRTGLAYSRLNEDLNGNYFLVNSDPGDSQLQSEYADVFFELKTPRVDGEVYVAGNFNNWQLNTSNHMIYDEARESYRAKLLLKQGYYDYMYWVDSDRLGVNHLEGNHFETLNEYEVLVYFRFPSRNFDELVGYKKIKSPF